MCFAGDNKENRSGGKKGQALKIGKEKKQEDHKRRHKLLEAKILAEVSSCIMHAYNTYAVLLFAYILYAHV